MISPENLELIKKLTIGAGSFGLDGEVWNVITALRGPDFEVDGWNLKYYSTAKLRWIIGMREGSNIRVYPTHGWVSYISIIEPARREQEEKCLRIPSELYKILEDSCILMESEKAHCYSRHFWNHFKLAVGAVGWEVKKQEAK